MNVWQEFEKALKNNYALGAFNFASLDILQAIIAASEKTKKTVIASVSEGAMKYLGEDFLKSLIQTTKARQNNMVILIAWKNI